MPPKPEEEAFLSRWSRRKQAGSGDPLPDGVPETPPAPPAEEPTDEELLAELDLPDPDTMGAADDFSAFMQARVPEHLRRRALRRLWRSNPVLANLDELVDYGEDYTDAATVMESMQTVYEVGKGAAEKWKRHVAALPPAEEEAQDAMPERAADEAEDPDAAPPPPAPLPDPGEDLPASAEVAPVSPPPRHMRFRFE